MVYNDLNFNYVIKENTNFESVFELPDFVIKISIRSPLWYYHTVNCITHIQKFILFSKELVKLIP